MLQCKRKKWPRRTAQPIIIRGARKHPFPAKRGELCLGSFLIFFLLVGELSETIVDKDVIPCKKLLDVVLVDTVAVIVLDNRLELVAESFVLNQSLDIDLPAFMFCIDLVKDFTQRSVAGLSIHRDVAERNHFIARMRRETFAASKLLYNQDSLPLGNDLKQTGAACDRQYLL